MGNNNPHPIRLMFLGNRRIAWEVLKILSLHKYRERFDLRVLVTDPSIWNSYRRINPQQDAIFISCERRETQKIYEQVKAQSIDVLLSIQYNWIIPANILSLVGYRAFNLHNARLPEYKGYNSITHALANGDDNYYTTLHWMSEEVDAGDAAYVISTPVRSDDTAETLYLRTIEAAVRATKLLLADLASRAQVPRHIVSNRKGTFYPRESAELLANVTDRVDTESLSNIARATFFPPFNTAYFLHQGKKYLIVPEDEVKDSLAGRAANEPQF